MSQDAKIVYSSDPKMNEKCPKCKELKIACRCQKPETVPAKVTAVMRIEKQGRGGKTVTVIDRLPKNEAYLKELCTELKKKCGSGGTYSLDGEHGQVEIQGEKREQIRALLEKRGYLVKG
jgi:translation initiation factor 1